MQARQDLAAHWISLDRTADHAVTLPAKADIYASQLFDPQDGFYGLEFTHDGLPFRWTGPQRSFSFSICVDRTVPLLVELEAIRLIDELRQCDAKSARRRTLLLNSPG